MTLLPTLIGRSISQYFIKIDIKCRYISFNVLLAGFNIHFIFCQCRKEFLDIFNINVGGCLEMTNVFLPLIQKEAASETPIVINISSSLGSMMESPRFTSTSYQCSKAAVNMLTKCQAAATPSVKFVAIHPGWVSLLKCIE